MMTWSEFLVLDPQLRDWVLLPIVFVMFFVSCFRHYLMKLMVNEKEPELEPHVEQQLLARSRVLRSNYFMIPRDSYMMRKQYLYEKFTEGTESNNTTSPLEAAMDPSNLSEAMKKNMAMIISQVLLMTWVNYFFSGFVLVKLPFPLTLRFKTMLQRGIDLTDLDVTYVSSISWYFLNLFGLRGINSLVLGESLFGEEELIKAQVSGNMGAAPRADPKKQFLGEKEELDLIQHVFQLDKAGENLLVKYSTHKH